MSTGSYLARRAIYQNLHVDESAGSKATAQPNRVETGGGSVRNSMLAKNKPEAVSRLDSDSSNPGADAASSVYSGPRI